MVVNLYLHGTLCLKFWIQSYYVVLKAIATAWMMKSCLSNPLPKKGEAGWGGKSGRFWAWFARLDFPIDFAS